MTSIEQLLKVAYPDELVDELLNAFRLIDENYRARRWKPSELDAGHFVEVMRRIVDLELTGSYPKLGKRLSGFTSAVLSKWENASGDESFRLIIPRVLWSMYTIRNKRGVAHVGLVSPNEADAALILRCARWCLAELARLKSTLSVEETSKLTHELSQRDIELIWTIEGLPRVLKPSMPAKDKVLVLLYHRSPMSDADLRKSIDYKNEARFSAILTELHRNRLIEHKPDGDCHLSPTGESRAEGLLLKTTI